ncbi:hypothetical protein HBF26_18230 [Luteibacter jiangsuensis]|uniref:Uncharacterized protein n=1 Tax=Luteibacter jiangsuensis TaxID=637577 RepID=A0ABX0QAN2_9GAMM|nr:hypothetical protein [Luteibacter jiangsuensis]NID06830.1 hypothetical protein [Luteibacter jiangsuensis]
MTQGERTSWAKAITSSSGTGTTTWSVLGAALPAAFIRGAALSSEPARGALSQATALPAAVTSSVDAQADAERKATLRLFGDMQRASAWDLVPGDRMLYMDELFGQYMGQADICLSALDRILHVDARYVSSDAKAAALRYLGMHETKFDLSRLKRLFLTSTLSQDFVTALAAARSLDDIADEATAGALKPSIDRSPFPEVRATLHKTLRRLKGMDDDETRSNTP